MRSEFMAAACAGLLFLAGCGEESKEAKQLAPGETPKVLSTPKIISTISPKAMTALLTAQGFTVQEPTDNAQAPVMLVTWPQKENGTFEVHFSDCKPGKTIAESECGVIAYAAWNDTVRLSPLQVNDVNAAIMLGRVFTLPKDGEKLKKGTTIFIFTLPLYGGVTETHVSDSIGGWGVVLQGFIDMLQEKGIITPPKSSVPTPAEAEALAE
jgi:hypothetical protein